MSVLYDGFIFWVVDLVINGIMVHDILVWLLVYGVGFLSWSIIIWMWYY